MWNVCRPAALQQLQRMRLVAREPLLRMSLMSATSALPSSSFASNATARSFATSATIAGVDMSKLTANNYGQLRLGLSKSQLQAVHRGLADEFAKVTASDDVTSHDIMELFTAADKTRQDSIVLRSFEYMQRHYPDEIDFVMYGAVYRVLARDDHSGNKLCKIYEFARPRYEGALPELIGRFGIVGLVKNGDMASAQEILEEMENDNVFVSNEIYSRMLAGYVKAENEAGMMEIYGKLDPQQGRWHETAVDRIILNLGIAKKPGLAFEFYVNANMKLNGGTLMTLLSVCRNNDCHQQAKDILANRKRFKLKLDARAYNGILQTYEFLGLHDQIIDVLEEMTNAPVAFDTRTKLIVARNQEHLQDTYFDLAKARKRQEEINGGKAPSAASDGDGDDDWMLKPKPSKGSHSDSKSDSDSDWDSGSDRKTRYHNATMKLNAYSARPQLQQFLSEGNIKEAVALADAYLRPVAIDDVPEALRLDGDFKMPANALHINGSIATQVVQAYMASGDQETVKRLLDGFALTNNPSVAYALTEIMIHYCGPIDIKNKKQNKNNNMTTEPRPSPSQQKLAYRAARILLDKDLPIHRTGQALFLFSKFDDTDAGGKMWLRQLDLLQSQRGDDNNGKSVNEKRKISATTVRSSLAWTTQFLVERNELAMALALLDTAAEKGFRFDEFHYTALLTGMRKFGAHTAKSKGVVVLSDNYRSKPFYYTSDDFESVLDHMQTHNVLPTRGVVGNACIGLAGGTKRQQLKLLEAYDVARQQTRDTYTLPPLVYSVLLNVCAKEEDNIEPLKALYEDALATLPVPKDGGVVVVPVDWEFVMMSRLAETGNVGEAVTRLLDLQRTSGKFSYEAIVKVFRASVKAAHHESIQQIVALLHERDFQLTLTDAYDLVYLAKNADLPQVAFDVLELYEKAHGRNTEDALGHSKSHQSVRDKFAVRKIRSMYKVALQLCEQNGEWKRALSFSTRVNELARFEDGEKEGEGGEGEGGEEGAAKEEEEQQQDKGEDKEASTEKVSDAEKQQ